MNEKLKRYEKAVDSALAEAEKIGAKEIAAVVDESGHLCCFKRMDGAAWGSIDLAINKAFTTTAWGFSTESITDSCRPDGVFHSIHFSNGLKLVTFGGGEPLIEDGAVVGAIGVSGGSVEQDVQCAKAGAKAF